MGKSDGQRNCNNSFMAKFTNSSQKTRGQCRSDEEAFSRKSPRIAGIFGERKAGSQERGMNLTGGEQVSIIKLVRNINVTFIAVISQQMKIA